MVGQARSKSTAAAADLGEEDDNIDLSTGGAGNTTTNGGLTSFRLTGENYRSESFNLNFQVQLRLMYTTAVVYIESTAVYCCTSTPYDK